MDELFTKYEHELVILRSICREYAQRYPKVAAQLQLGGDACADPHVERLIQAVALLSARVAKRLDDSYPQFTEALLYPHYLRPFPSCAIARFVGEPGEDGAPAHTPEVPRGTRLDSPPVQDVPCTFTTVYDVGPCALALADASFDTAVHAPVSTRLPEDTTAILALAFETARAGEAPARAAAAVLRLYADADASLCAALRDILFVHARAAYVQLGDDGPWERLPAVPIMAVGFAQDEALIPHDARSHAAYRVLAEYFAFPDKFNFFDIDVPAILARVPADCMRFTLHLALGDVDTGGAKARMLANLSKQHLLEGCTPVVNLFSQPGVPVAYDQLSDSYTVLANASIPHAFEVYSIDKVSMVRQSGKDGDVTEFRPFYSLRHGDDGGTECGRYWLMRHDETLAMCSPGHEKSITLVNADRDPYAVERNTLSIELTCTNRGLPCALRVGSPGGDLFVPGAGKNDYLVRLLRRPSRPLRLANGPDMHWRLISHLSLNHHSLITDGAEGLREMLALYDLAQSPVSRRQVRGLVALEQSPTTAWIRHKRGASLVHGTEVRLTLDEEAYAGAGLHLFVQVLDEFLALYVHLNSFVELVILSHQSGKELFRCKPRSGRMNLL